MTPWQAETVDNNKLQMELESGALASVLMDRSFTLYMFLHLHVVKQLTAFGR